MTDLLRVHLKDHPCADTLDPDIVREAIVAIARFACDDARGRVKGDYVFERVTEGRQSCWVVNGKQRCYSGCGDLAQFVLWLAAGAERYTDPAVRRAMRYTNRAEAWGWKQGWNISMLDGFVPSGSKVRHRPGDKLAARPGDLLLIGEGGQEHIMVVRDIAAGRLTSLDYGQFFDGKHGGRQCVRTLRKGPDGRLWAFSTTPPGRPVVWSIDTGSVLRTVSGTGALLPAVVPAPFDKGIVDDNPYFDPYL